MSYFSFRSLLEPGTMNLVTETLQWFVSTFRPLVRNIRVNKHVSQQICSVQLSLFKPSVKKSPAVYYRDVLWFFSFIY